MQCTFSYQFDAPCSQDMTHGSQVEHMERKAELHSNAVGDLKQDPELGKKRTPKFRESPTSRRELELLLEYQSPA